MTTALGEAAGSPMTIDVVGVGNNRWLVRTRYLNELPTNLITFINREVANDFAVELQELTADMATKLHGFPARVELAEADDATT